MIDGWFRRRYLWYLKKGHVLAWKEKREGECARCGRCCRGCPAFDAAKKRCKIYKVRPDVCKHFPLTPDDIKKIDTCGFRFKS